MPPTCRFRTATPEPMVPGQREMAGSTTGVRAARLVSPALVPGITMLLVGFTGATHPVLSWDEIATADAAGRSLAQLAYLARHLDAVFVPYYLLMHLWTGVAGDSVLALRAPSIVAMAAAVAITGELGRRLFGRPVGMLAGLLLCLVPNVSRYAAEARPYAFVCCFATAALLQLHRALDRPGPARWTAYGMTVLALGLSHVVALTVLAAHAVIVAARVWHQHRARLVAAWAVPVLAVSVLLSPLLWWGLQERGAQLHWLPPLTGGQVYTFPAQLAGTPVTAWLVIGMALAAPAVPRRELASMAAAAAIPVLLVLAVSAAGPSFWVARYLLFVLMPTAIVAAAGLVHTGAGLRRPVAVARLAAVLLVVAGTAFPAQRTVRGATPKNGSDYRALTRDIEARQLPGDVVVYQRGRTLRAGVGYYLRHDPGRPRDILMSRTPAQTGTFTAAEVPDAAAALAGVTRIWLVVFGNPTDPATRRRDLTGLLRTRFRPVGEWRVKWATMVLYARSGPVNCAPARSDAPGRRPPACRP